MPIYEYRCKECGEERELLMDIGEERKIRCSCGKTMTKLISAGAFVVDGKLSSSNNANSPEGVQQANELRKKHLAKGDHKEWAKENKAKAKVDGKFSYET